MKLVTNESTYKLDMTHIFAKGCPAAESHVLEDNYVGLEPKSYNGSFEHSGRKKRQ